MKELFTGLAQYNGKTNNEILELIDTMSKEQLIKTEKTYNGSIYGTLVHVIISDCKWLKRLSFIYSPDFDNSLLDFFTDSDNSQIFSKHEDLKKLRNSVDREIINLISQIGDLQLSSEVEISFGDSKIKLVLWKLLLQWFNHHTHHRGQISVLFDLQDIYNDYSILLNKID